MNNLSENTPEYPEDFEQAMKVFFGINERDNFSKIQIPPSGNFDFTVSKLFRAILSGKMIDSQDIDNPSWDHIENNRKTLKKDNIFPNASIDDLDKIYFAITIAIKKYLFDKKTLASYQPTDLDSNQYSIYAFVIDRFYTSMNANIATKILSNSHNQMLDLLENSQVK